jgi:chaperone required for assembly of F1-ATPase
VAEQNKTWQPYLDWCKEAFTADLRTGQGIVPFEQNKEALAALRREIEKGDAFLLTGLSEACGTLGSLVLGLALMAGRAGAEAVFEAAELDHNWQNKKWGEDPVSQSRHADIKRDLDVCARWFALLKK